MYRVKPIEWGLGSCAASSRNKLAVRVAPRSAGEYRQLNQMPSRFFVLGTPFSLLMLWRSCPGHGRLQHEIRRTPSCAGSATAIRTSHADTTVRAAPLLPSVVPRRGRHVNENLRRTDLMGKFQIAITDWNLVRRVL